MQPVSEGRITDEEVPGLYTGSGSRTNTKALSVLFWMRCGTLFTDTGSLSDGPFTQPVVIPGFCTTFQ